MSQDLIVKDTGVLARAELDTQIATAKSYPRQSLASITEYATELATLDEDTAQSCFYCLPRTDKDGVKKEIRGPSIRLAEIIMCAWGNIHAATRIIENDGRHITAEGVAWDLQTNVKTSMQVKVGIIFGGKNGTKEYTANADMQTVLSNAASAKALRNAIFKVVPKVLVDRVYERAMTFAIGDQKTVNRKVSEIFDKLTKMGIAKQKILDYYGRASLAEVTGEDFKSLIGVGTAIKEGHLKIEDAFSTLVQSEDQTNKSEELIDEWKKEYDSATGEIKS